mgnify:CR=1 FL=1
MGKSRDSTSASCPSCNMYMSRIKELEELNDMHRRINGELREVIAEWTSTNMKNDMEKK